MFVYDVVNDRTNELVNAERCMNEVEPMEKRKLSPRQQCILDYLESYQNEHGYPPSIREIGIHCGISSTSVVNYNLNILEEAKYISRESKVSRGIRREQPAGGVAGNTLQVPLVGRIFASQPVEYPDPASSFSPEDMLTLTKDLIREKDLSELFALEVRGDSMVDAMVSDGDYVVMKKTHDARNGEMVAVWLHDQNATTLKHFYREADGRVRLQPANPYMEPIYADPRNVQVQGKVVLVVRQLK